MVPPVNLGMIIYPSVRRLPRLPPHQLRRSAKITGHPEPKRLLPVEIKELWIGACVPRCDAPGSLAHALTSGCLVHRSIAL